MKRFLVFLFVMLSLLPGYHILTSEQQTNTPITTQDSMFQEFNRRNVELGDRYREVVNLLQKTARSSDPELISLTASALVKEAQHQDVDYRLVYGVLMIENPWLDTTAVSHAGAYGQMQIMPEYWADEFPQCDSYKTLEGNMCIGIKVLKHYLESNPTQRRALLSYNGCVSDHCQNYPFLVNSYIERTSLGSIMNE